MSSRFWRTAVEDGARITVYPFAIIADIDDHDSVCAQTHDDHDQADVDDGSNGRRGRKAGA